VKERPAVSPERRQEPESIECARADARSPETTRDEQNPASGLRDKVIGRQVGRSTADRIDDPLESGRPAPAEDGEGAVLEADDRRPRQTVETLDVAGYQTRLHSDQLSGSDEIHLVGHPLTKRKLSREPVRIGADPVVCCDRA
jgi:hypothetical protein